MNKTVKHCISAAAFFIMLIAAVKFLDYLLVPMSRADFFLHDMARMKEKGPNIDMVIIGNSHSLFGFNPSVFEKELSLDNVYNASVTGIQISSMYYIAESIIEDFEPEIVLLAIDWDSLREKGTTRTQAKLLGLDRLTGLRKLKHLFNDFYSSEMIYGVLRPYRFRDNIFKVNTIAGNIKMKKWAEKTRYEEDYYQTIKGYDKGSACSSSPYKISEQQPFNKNLLSDRSIGYLDKLTELCKIKNIHLVLVIPPVSTMQLMKIESYQQAIDYYNTYAKEKNIVFFDMNMLKNRDIIFNDHAFYDQGHLCESGAAAASRICSEVIQKKINNEDVSDLFYLSTNELATDIKRVVSVGADIITDNRSIVISNLQAIAGKDMDVTFEIMISLDGTHYESKFQNVQSDDQCDFFIADNTNSFFIRIIGRDSKYHTESFADYQISL